MLKKSKGIPVVGLVLIILFVIITGCANVKEGDTKEKIQATLSGNGEVSKITWSPDNKMVVYLQSSNEKNGLDEAYLWSVGDKTAKLVRDVKPTTQGFSWAPNSNYFIISEKLGDGSENSIVKADTLTEETYKIKSISMPIWSPDSLSLAYGNEMHDFGTSWGSLEVYTLGAAKSEYIWKAINYLYKVESWDQAGNIGYTEISPSGQEVKKSTKNIRPSISGVHLGDTKEQVKAALGNDYEETPPGEETIYFPEKVYRWDYAKGFKIFIGAESGKVLEMSATSPQAETNLGIKTGDTAKKVFETYRPKYIEPESIHGGIVYGLFKVEGAAALFFNFDLKEGQELKDIKPENKVERMILTYPELLDDSF